MGAVAAAVAVALTIALFRTIGAKRTRLVAQIVAAVIGAAFVIGLQVAAILSYGSLSRFAPLQSDWLIARAPDVDSAFWWPARAAMGDAEALVVIMALSLALLGASIAIFSGRFGDHARPPPACRIRAFVSAAGRKAFAAARRNACCAKRNGRCCGATPG